MTSLTQPLATSMADERQRADDEMHDDGTVTSTMTADAIEYTISGEIHSGVGVLDKTVKILDALESGPATLGQLVSATGLARPTAHRLAIALERHRFVLRDQHGRFVLGSRFAELAAAAGEDRLLTAAGPILQTLLDRTGESAQIYRRQGDQRVCIAAAGPYEPNPQVGVATSIIPLSEPTKPLRWSWPTTTPIYPSASRSAANSPQSSSGQLTPSPR